jgi:hypothetical protein
MPVKPTFFNSTKVLVSIVHGIIFSLHEGMEKMIQALSTLERRARVFMIVVSIFSIIAAVLYKTGLVATEAAYEHHAWYSFTKHAGFIISTQHSDEAACRSVEKLPTVVCRSGRSMMLDQSKDPFS